MDQTGPIPASTVEAGLSSKVEGIPDMGSKPVVNRRDAAARQDEQPPGIVERRKPSAIPGPRGRRRTMPPVPSRSERDRLASMSTGFAPGLASESFHVPQRESAESGPATSLEQQRGPTLLADAPEAAPLAEVHDTHSENRQEWPAPSTPIPVAHPPSASHEWSAPSTPIPVVHPPSASHEWSAPAAPIPVAHPPSSSHEWPAPATAPAPHADDWNAVPPLAQIPRLAAVSATHEASGAVPIVEERSSQTQSQANAWPPPTRTTPHFEPFKAPEIVAIPSVPDAGLWPAMRYTISFARARWQRRGAIGDLQEQIRRDTGLLDGILGTLGRHARALAVESKALNPENRAIDEAERRRKTAEHECSEISNRQAEEASKFADTESERLSKLADAEQALTAAQEEYGGLEAQKRSLRDKRKLVESRQKGYIKAAEGRESEAAKEAMGPPREELRQSAGSLRRDAAALDQERQDIERRMDALERPMEQISSRIDALKSDVDAAKRALNDLREGHRHRLAELEAEQGRKSRELAQAEAEIQRRLVTLGTLVNLNRIERVEFRELYEQIDTLRGSIGARSNEIDKLSAEREAYDKASLIRGACVLGGVVLVSLSLLAILLAIF